MSKSSHLIKKAFLDGPVGIQRYDTVKYPHIETWNNMGLAHFWRPEEVDITKDREDFNSLTEAEKHIFFANLKRQIKLDSVQGREPVQCFAPLASLPEIENGWMNLSFQETIHSRSYTHILRNTVADPSIVFDNIDNIPEIVELGDELEKYYNQLEHLTNTDYGSYEHKKALWLALISANALEGIRFYVSFACSWAFAQILNKMEGNAKIIKLIARDENEHLKFVQDILDICLAEDPDFVKIREETIEQVHEIYYSVLKQEQQWAKYLFQYGDMLGLDEKTCSDYAIMRTLEVASANGYTLSLEEPLHHPIPWITDWISSGRKQNALQETENDSYLLGITTGDLDLSLMNSKYSKYNITK